MATLTNQNYSDKLSETPTTPATASFDEFAQSRASNNNTRSNVTAIDANERYDTVAIVLTTKISSIVCACTIQNSVTQNIFCFAHLPFNQLDQARARVLQFHRMYQSLSF